MPAEDFAYYLQKVPGCFMFVGAGNPDKNAIYPHHHPMFDFDEDAMQTAVRLFIAMAKGYTAE
ncbi:putative hydrolase YxeP [compost metagenome]